MRLKVLFITSKSDDYLSACLWDGFQQLCQEKNVVDAGESPYLHSWLDPKTPASRIGAWRKGEYLRTALAEWKFDLIVINACANRDLSWGEIDKLVRERLVLGGKVAYVEGWDSAIHEIFPPEPPTQIDLVFRREIDPDYRYPYRAIPLSFAAPERWFDGAGRQRERPIDVFFAGQPAGPIRKEMFAVVGGMHGRHKIVLSSIHFPGDEYFSYMRQAKYALCPPGCDGCDAMRFWEAAACGAIPIFIGMPNKVHGEWFTEHHALFVSEPKDLPLLIDAALDVDLEPIRKELVKHARAHHTTIARAMKIVRELGLG